MNQVELIEALTAKGYSAGFAGTMLVVTVNDRADVPGVVQTKVKYSKSLPVFIKFRNGDIEPIYYGSESRDSADVRRCFCRYAPPRQ